MQIPLIYRQAANGRECEAFNSGEFYTLKNQKYTIEEKVLNEEQYQWLEETYSIYNGDDLVEQVLNYKEALEFLSNN